jgi:hypothetical protein
VCELVRGRALALFWRIWIALIVVNVVVLSIFVGIATFQFGNINSDLIGERLFVLADRTAAPFRAAAKIGLPLSTVRNTDALLESARQTDDAILAIHLFDASERIISSTGSLPADGIPAAVAAARGASDGARWRTETRTDFLSGVEIVARDGTRSGGILIVYPGSGNTTRVRAMVAELGLVALGAILATAVLSALVLRISLARQIRLFEAIDGAIATFERLSWRGTASGSASAAAGEAADLYRLLEAAESRYRAECRALQADADQAR